MGTAWATALAFIVGCTGDTGVTVHVGDPPAATIVEPADGELVPEGDLVVTTKADDDLTAPEDLELSLTRIDGEPLAVAVTATSDDVTNWLVAGLTAGEVTLVFEAIDADAQSATDQITVTVAPDNDGDGYLSSAHGGTDCDDDDPAIFPGAEEICDGLDNDCDGTADDGLDLSTWYYDNDDDGYGDPNTAYQATTCSAPLGYVDNGDDCNDYDADVTPETWWYPDVDGDGFGTDDKGAQGCEQPDGHAAVAGDCDDADAAVHPDADEICNDLDDDCDTLIDDDDEVVDGLSTFYADTDADGFGDSASTTEACTSPSGYGDDATDCDDADATVHPDATEVCNDVDDDCDGLVDDDDSVDLSTGTVFYQDTDGDGYGDPDLDQRFCAQSSGWATTGDDCDDSLTDVNPAATEICNELDDDCDGLTDDEDDSLDSTTTTTWYADADSDGYGDPATATATCEAPSGYVDNDVDCDDADADTTPTTVWYADVDGDGFGDSDSTSTACDQPSGFVEDPRDCDDADADVHPDADELCDELDNDCDGDTDEDTSTDASTWYADDDGDGYGDADDTSVACAQPTGAVADATDCDDTDAAVSPAGVEVCNSIDDDCDDLADEEDTDLADASTWYTDADSDGYGDPASSTEACTRPVGTVDDDTDCDDSDGAIHPSASEVCDDVDNDCDLLVDDDDDDIADASTWYADDDDDGFGDDDTSTSTCDAPSGFVGYDGDCDDGDAAVNPAADETCNGLDDDCDGLVDDDDGDVTDQQTWYYDSDSDGYGGSGTSTVACDAPSGFVDNDADCDDGEAAANPGENEACDDLDNDCDGDVDEASSEDASEWFLDADGDGYGDPLVSTSSCEGATGYVADATDCDDADSSVNPGEDEVCNDADDDCDGDTDEDDDDLQDATSWYADLDGDGFGDADDGVDACEAPSGYVDDAADCDDLDAAVHPDALEICNDLDDDCNGLVDEDDGGLTDATTWYLDADGDGYGLASSSTDACDAPSSYVENGTDCDDGESASNPGETEVCDDLDNDCDGDADGDATDASTWYADSDGDGYGDADSSQLACDAPSSHVSDATDCDDDEASANPGEEEVCDGLDNDCDGDVDADASDAGTWYLDDDADGFGDAAVSEQACDQPAGYTDDATDCDDAVASVNPDGTEDCDGVDDDCDDVIDEDAVDDATWYADVDGDGYGDDADTLAACSQPSGYVLDGGDCDDLDSSASPGELEVCDGIDNDCDGDADEAEATDATTWYADADADGYGDADVSEVSCTAPTGYIADATDCDDTAATVSPSGTEVCDGADNDCDGDTDETDAADASTWYADADGDGYGDPEAASVACDAPADFVADATDCDDDDADVSPSATEVCDGIDNDCSGVVDEASSADAATWYADADGDGYGDLGTTTPSCDQPSDYVADDSDCDDGDSAISPAATEVCDGVDNDCSGDADEATASDATTWYVDADGDGYGDATSSEEACDQPSGSVAGATDCDDADAAIHPGADEICDGLDNDCDSSIDEPSATDASTWYADADADGYGDADVTDTACDQPSGYVADSTDCNDDAASANPVGTEVCDGLDNDCNGTVDDGATDDATWYLDDDGDGFGDSASSQSACTQPTGYVLDATDCDDADAAVHPDSDELCDGLDNDCDGDTDEASATDASTWYADADGDGYGSAVYTTTGCDQPTGYVGTGDDCDDTDAGASPGETEVCDDVDNDCDGSTDESSAADATTWWYDNDGDGWGGSASSKTQCDQPTGYEVTDSDCDDTDADVNADAIEVCDGQDNDCDGTVDGADATDVSTWYADDDGDSYGDPDSSADACDQPTGYVADSSDCDDADGAVRPDATEVCDGVDNDCSGTADGSDAADATTYYADVDGDTYGDSATTQDGCSAPSGYVSDDTDCDDDESSANPGETEVCNDGIDNDCDGTVNDCGWAAGDTESLSSADAQVLASAANDSLGEESALAFVGDVDGDGADEVLAGARSAANAAGVSSGVAYLLSGALSGTSDAADVALATFEGEAASDRFGYGVSGLDFDGDGFADVAIGAYSESSVGTSNGAAYLFSGASTGTVGGGDADVVIYGEAGDQLGWTTSGDLNDDGYDDLVVGMPGWSDWGWSSGGSVDVVNGPITASGMLYSLADSSFFGTMAQEQLSYELSTGDVDGDGVDDLLMSSQTYSSNTGRGYVVLGPFSGVSGVVSGKADAILSGTGSQYLGSAIEVIGDHDGDGYNDVAVGAYVNNASGCCGGQGMVYIIDGPVDADVDLDSDYDARIGGHTSTEYIGTELDAAGDLDDDGYDDFLIGADAYYTAYGMAVAVFGPFGGTQASDDAGVVFSGEARGDYAGSSVAGGGDLDGDGWVDVLIGADHEATNGSDAGAAYLFYGEGL